MPGVTPIVSKTGRPRCCAARTPESPTAFSAECLKAIRELIGHVPENYHPSLVQGFRQRSPKPGTRPGQRVAAFSPIRPRFSFCDSPEKAVGLSESGAAQPRRRVPHRPVNHKRRRSGWICYPLPGPHSKKDVIGPKSAHCASRHLNEVTSIRPARIKRAPGNVQQLPDAKGEFRQRFSTQ